MLTNRRALGMFTLMLVVSSSVWADCNSIRSDDLRYYCKSDCNSIRNDDLRYFCKSDCNSVRNDDLRHLCKSSRRYPGTRH